MAANFATSCSIDGSRRSGTKSGSNEMCRVCGAGTLLAGLVGAAVVVEENADRCAKPAGSCGWQRGFVMAPP